MKDVRVSLKTAGINVGSADACFLINVYRMDSDPASRPWALAEHDVILGSHHKSDLSEVFLS
jgi:hypothetical protein